MPLSRQNRLRPESLLPPQPKRNSGRLFASVQASLGDTFKRRAFTLLELLVVVAITGILVGLLLPAVQAGREAARRVGCQNNLRQLGLALHLFQNAYKVFPASGWTKVGPGNPAGKYVGWRPLTLPFLEQDNLRAAYDVNANWWESPNLTAAALPVATFQCPSTPTRPSVLSAVAKAPRPAVTFPRPLAPTDYDAIMGVQPASINPHVAPAFYNSSNRYSVMYRNSMTRLDDIRDGTSSTIMIVECAARPLVFRQRKTDGNLANDQGIGWADSEGPFSLDGARADGSAEGCGPAAGCTRAMNARNDNEPYSFHPGGSHFVFADAHVSYLAETMDLPTLAALCTMAAGDATARD